MSIFHIIVFGFHHKKGCQVEFSYPPLIAGNDDNTACPPGWKYLPTLGLPDGSHNFLEDSVFFNLPSLTDPNETVFGVSCYRQISVDKLKIRTADVTRSTVQKSVCALASIPIYGYIEVKLSLIAHAFFDQGDFGSTDLLVKAWHQLNACLMDCLSSNVSQSLPLKYMFIGLPLRDIILKWRYKAVILFKLMLLQKRVVFFGSPVRPICSLILGIASLHPELLNKGFRQAACVRTSRPMSPMPDFNADASVTLNKDTINVNIEEPIVDNIPNTDTILDQIIVSENECNSSIDELCTKSTNMVGKRIDKNSLPRDSSVDTLAGTLLPLRSFAPEIWNAPFPIYTNGNLCLPYLSLPYMDLLSDPSVHGYTIGTSNILFQQKKQLADVLIDVETSTIETADHELKRQLTLTTEDLRFVDYIVRHTQTPKEDAEGSEQWIRDQFQGYMLAMLRTSQLIDDNKEIEHFNGSFMCAWRQTNCYVSWLDQYEQLIDKEIFDNIPFGHPFSGTLSVTDMKLKLAQTMNNSESGRKLNQAVNTTSRAVGGALSHAKGALTNWWSSLSTTQNNTTEKTNGTTLNNDDSQHLEIDDHSTLTLTDNNIGIDQVKSFNDNNVINGDIDKKSVNFESVQNQQEFTNQSSDDVVSGIVEIGIEAMILQSK